jgi:hypothetical protein
MKQRTLAGQSGFERYTKKTRLNSESFGSLLATSLRRSKSGLSAWSRESISGMSGSLSNRMCTKKNDCAPLDTDW